MKQKIAKHIHKNIDEEPLKHVYVVYANDKSSIKKFDELMKKCNSEKNYEKRN